MAEINVSETDLEAVKAYMRKDGNDEDSLIESLYTAAVIYLDAGGVKKPASDNALYNLAVWSLTLHYYEHRDAVGNEAAFPIGLRPIINQLKQTGLAAIYTTEKV